MIAIKDNKYLCSLVCWTCGKRQEIKVDHPPEFAFQIAKWAKDIGWIGILDFENSRSLIFCSERCCENAKTKKGAFKKKSPRPV